MRRAWTLAIALVACADEPSAPQLEPEAPAPPPTAAARWEPVRRPGDAVLLEHPARAAVDPSASGEVGVPFRARVVRVRTRVGERVTVGDPIVEVVMPEVLEAAAAARGAALRAEAHRARANELARLREEGLIDAARVFEQRATVAELEAERARALAVLRSASLDPAEARTILSRGTVVLRAPAAGTVRTLDARLGELREPGAEPIATIVGAGDARIEVRSSEPLAPFASATFEAADGPSVPLRAEPIAVVTDPAEGTHVTWLAPAAAVRLEDGLRGRVRLRLDAPEVVEVPSSALVPTDTGAVVVRRDGDTYARVPVEVVASSGATSLVRGPLAEDDVVARNPSALESELE
ncbi:MAG: efflux RND transporter periplasmic adaptor subunit [Sandaracinaceae bacterium]|nr:efflux RND transporter periplasmic adaptor subunit [Sandaracinaceae bacterium]